MTHLLTWRTHLVALCVVAVSIASWVPAPARAATDKSVRPYRGLGSWVDIYDTKEWNHPGSVVRKMKRKGVRTLYLETGNYRQGSAIFRPADVDRFIHAAHRRGIKVVAWYLPGFKNLKQDLYRSMAAIRHRTSRGHRFDGFGLDIEATLVSPIQERIRRMIRLSRRIDERVKPSYPLGAIIPSPYGMKRSPNYWGPVDEFPFAKLANIYDVIVPMSYFTWRVQGMRPSYRYNTFNIRYIRDRSGDDEVGIHLIGGIAGEAGRKGTRGYVRAVREHGILGGGFYAFDSMQRYHWSILRSIPMNPLQSPALPVGIGQGGYFKPLGNVPGEDTSHPKEAFFQMGERTTPAILRFRAFGVQKGEVQLQVNWRSVMKVRPTPGGAWGDVQRVEIPRWRLHDDRRNSIAFVAKGDYPRWSTWGVKNVRVSSP